MRQQLAQEIAVLEGVDEPDITGLSAQISALSKTVTGLPMQGRRMAMPEQRPGEAEQAQPFWKRFVLSLWQEIKTLVVIRHDGKAIAPLLPPEQEEFLYLNLQHKLESARLALLKGQTSIWRDNLQAAQDWARRYFDPDAQETRAIVEALARLHDSTISVNLPDISESLRLLQEFRQRQARQTSSRHDASSMAGIFVTPAHSG